MWNGEGSRGLRVAAFVIAGASFAAVAFGAGAEALPSNVETAVRALYPNATVLGSAREREGDVQYHEVVVQDGGQRIEIEVAPDGSVGEIESDVKMADLPPAVRDAVLAATGGVKLRGLTRHEVRGVPQGNRFAPVDPPQTVYEAAFVRDGVHREVAFGADGTSLRIEDDADGDDDDDEESGSATSAAITTR